MNDASFAAFARVMSLRAQRASEVQLRDACAGEISLDRAAAVARAFGMPCRVVEVLPRELAKLNVPTLIELSDGSLIVLRKVRWRRVDVDSGKGTRRLSADEVTSRFSGRALDFGDRLAEGTSALRRLLVTVAENRRGLILALGVSIFVQLLGVVVPQFTRVIVDRAIPGAASSLLSMAALGVVFVAAFQMLLEWLRQRALTYFEARAGIVVENGFLQHLMRLPFRVLNMRTTGALLQSFYSVNTLRGTAGTRVFIPLIQGVLAVAYLAALAAMIPSTFVLATAGGVVLASIGIVGGILQARASRYELTASAGEGMLAVEAIGNIATVRAAAAEPRMMRRWVELLHTREFYTLKRQEAAWISDTAVDGIQQLFVCGMLFWGGTLVLHGQLSAGSMIAAVQLAMGFLASVVSLIAGVVAFINLAPQWEQVKDILERPVSKPPALVSHRVEGPIVLDHVSFRYAPDAPWVLKDFSLRLEANEQLSLSAHSGWGKSTILRLVAGLYEPEEGSVTIGGLDPKVAREYVAYLPQFSAPVAGSIISALRFFSGDASIEHLLEVSAATGLHDWVHSLPMQYETVLSTRGETVSGGQRQLIALTGVLASNRPILLLDEFVASLDGPARERILRSRLLENRTVILADHTPADPVLG